MCTAIKFNQYFGRNLDLEKTYGEKICITPRNFPFYFREVEPIKKHYAIIGMAYIQNDYPLYFDAANEYGLAMAGLNFPNEAYYNFAKLEGKKNIAPFELIPYLLGNYKSIQEVKGALKEINIVHIDYSDTLKLSPLHWLISDLNASIVLEATKEGMKVYDNPTNVLSNSPSFDKQYFNLNNYQGLKTTTLENTFSSKLNLNNYSYGMGALGLPGDLSSMSRFVRASFYNLNAISFNHEGYDVQQFFHLLDSVSQVYGANEIRKNEYEYTVYSACINLKESIYYYKTYFNQTINAVYLKNEDLESMVLKTFALNEEFVFNHMN